MLLVVEDLVEAVHAEKGDPGHAELRDDLVGHRRLAAGRAAAHAYHERFHLRVMHTA